MKKGFLVLMLSIAALAQQAEKPNYPAPKAGDFTVSAFQFQSGEKLDVKLHYYTFGTPVKDASGRVTNAVMILHGTGGSGRQFLRNSYAGVLFNPGQLLDATKYFIVLPDNVGHGNSSKPSDGMRMKFPQYTYDDMVMLQHALLTQGLGVNHLRLVMGTSMGCMHSWVWAEMYPDFVDAAMPLACLPTEIAGRNRMWRKMLMDGIRHDPVWNNGNYTQEPIEGLRIAEDLLMLVGTTPLVSLKQAPTREAADRMVEQRINASVKTVDANDMLYQFDSSRNYNPEPKLETITAPVMAVNSADDFINPPELGILERDIRRVKRGRAVVLPITSETRGHGTHTIPTIWGAYLADLLEVSGGMAPGTSWSGQPENPAPQPLRPATTTQGAAPPTGVYRVGEAGVSPPRAVYNPDPKYTDEAAKAKLEGSVIVSGTVEPDGSVDHIFVRRGLGMGLDEKAVEAVSRWRFEPARKDGKPVATQVNVEVNFRVQH